MAIRLGPAWIDRADRTRQTSTRQGGSAMKDWQEIIPPANAPRFRDLMVFADDVLTICERLDITTTLSGSLAVLAYTLNPGIVVNDVDLACSEAEFPRLSTAFAEQDIESRIKSWHVLQVHRDGLKVEFDSAEHWMSDLSGRFRQFDTGRFVIRVVELEDLRELYRRGLQDLETNRREVRHVRSRYELIMRAAGDN